MIWHHDSVDKIVRTLGSDTANGLTEQAAAQKLAEVGPNRLTEKKKKSFLSRVLESFKDFMVIILLAAAVISVITIVVSEHSDPKEWLEPIVIMVIVLLNAFLGAFQESKAEAALDALKDMSAPSAKVLRGGHIMQVKVEQLVPGDIMLLEAGDIVPADARLIESATLKCEESALTGESVPSEKFADAAVSEQAGIGDRSNMVFSGCPVVYGRAKAVVTGTGMSTEMGKIAAILSETEEAQTPLQVSLASLGKFIGILVLGICAVIVVIGLFLEMNFLELFMTAVSLAVSAVPEGLPVIVTLVLAIGVQRMVKKNAIIRRLPAVETLGSASVICSDKTGTLTQNRMTLVKVYDGVKVQEIGKSMDEAARKVLLYGTICCDGSVEMEKGREKHIGDPTETSIVAALLKYYGTTKQEVDAKYPRRGEIPFDSERKLMTTVNEIDGKLYAVVKGAPDILISKCKNMDAKAALKANSEMASNAIRVLGVAFKPLGSLPGRLDPDEIEDGLEFLGLVGMIDPPREEAKEAIRLCKKAGIRVIMITGDHVETAAAIAKQLGIMEEGHKSVTGKDIAAMSDDALFNNLEQYSVFARVSPQDKIRIVTLWQKKGHVVAMTGDGVNDAPALKAADIGCAMGITGTEVAKGAAAMTLTDDNFATIVTAVSEGRGIYANIRKAVIFLLSCNMGEVVAVFFAFCIFGISPLTPLMLLWINLITDSLPALALGMEPVEKDVMDKPPRKKHESLFAHGHGIAMALEGVLVGAITLIAYWLGSQYVAGQVALFPGHELYSQPNYGHEYGMTMAFLVLSLSQLVHAFNLRSNRSLFKVGFHTNKYMLGAFAVSVALALIVVLTPLRTLFDMVQLTGPMWLEIIGLSLAPLVLVELGKLGIWLHRIRKKKATA